MIRFSRHILHYGGHLMWFMGIKNPGYAWIQSVILLFIFYRVSSYNIRGSQIAPHLKQQMIHFNFAVGSELFFYKGTYRYQSVHPIP